MLTDIAIDPAGDVWAMNNWQDIDSCIGTPVRRSRLDVADKVTVVIFYGMAKPVQTPQIGPARRP